MSTIGTIYYINVIICRDAILMMYNYPGTQQTSSDIARLGGQTTGTINTDNRTVA